MGLTEFADRLVREPTRYTDREVALRAGRETLLADLADLRRLRAALARSIEQLTDEYRKGYRHAVADVLDGCEIARREMDEAQLEDTSTLQGSLQIAVAQALRLGPANLTELTGRLGKDPGLLSRTLAKLRKRGLVEELAARTPDGRVRTNRLTVQGRRALEHAERKGAAAATLAQRPARGKAGEPAAMAGERVATAPGAAASPAPAQPQAVPLAVPLEVAALAADQAEVSPPPEPAALAPESVVPDACDPDFLDEETLTPRASLAASRSPRQSFDEWALLIAQLESQSKWSELSSALTERAQAILDTVTLDEPRASPERQKAALLLKQAADIQQNKSRSADAAASLLERALELTPEDRELPLALADAYLAAHRTSDAQDLLLGLIESVGERRTKQRALCHQRLGRTLRELGDPSGALDHFRQACRVAPSASMLYDLGVSAFETDRLDLARKTFEWLLLQLGAGPKAAVFHYLAQISTKQGDREKAICFYEAGLQDAKRNESATQGTEYRSVVATTSG